MKMALNAADRLSPEQIRAWRRLQREDAAIDSPYFCPEFTAAVAAVRNDVEVAVLEEDGEYVGFFPFQRGSWQIGRPVGGPLSDFQGLVARRGLVFSAEELIRDCGLAAWDFDHLVTTQHPFRPHHKTLAVSPYMDLSEGFDNYESTLRDRGSTELRRVPRKLRKIQREVGALRFEAHTTDSHVFDTLIDWKKEQYQATGMTDVFCFGWTIALLERIRNQQEERFAGMLSALYAGDQLAAVHFGMRSDGVLHFWFPAYNRTLAKYSPGTLLLVELAKAAQSLGIRRIDLGKGPEAYKTHIMSDATAVAEGSVECRPLIRALRRGWRRTRDWVRSSPLRAPAEVPARVIRRVRARFEFR